MTEGEDNKSFNYLFSYHSAFLVYMKSGKEEELNSYIFLHFLRTKRV